MEFKPLAWYKLRDVFEKITGKEIHLTKDYSTEIYWDPNGKYVTIRCPMSNSNDYARYEHELAHLTFGTNPSYLQDLAVRIGKELNLIPWSVVNEYVTALECVRVQSLWAKLYSGSHSVFTRTIKKEVTPLDVTLGLAFKLDFVPSELQKLKPIVDRIKHKSIWSLYDVAKSYVSELKLRQQEQEQKQDNAGQSQGQSQTQQQSSTGQTQQQSGTIQTQQTNTVQVQQQDTSQTQQQRDATSLLPDQQRGVKRQHMLFGASGYDKEKYEELEDIDDEDSKDIAMRQLEEVKEKVRELSESERSDKRLMFPVEVSVQRGNNCFTDDSELTRELTRLFSKFKGTNYYIPSEQGTAIDIEGYIQRLSGTNAEQWLDVKNRSRLTVVVVLDLSDSMGDVLELLARVGLSLRKALEGVKAIRFRVYGYYGWGERVHVKELAENEMIHLSCIGTTPTAEALEYVDAQLEDTSDRKLMIIVTDGEPTDMKGHRSDKTVELTRYRVNLLRQHGVQVFTIVLLPQQRQVQTWIKRAFGPEGAYTVARSDSVGKIVVGMVASRVVRALTY